jgi:MFS family permease
MCCRRCVAHTGFMSEGMRTGSCDTKHKHQRSGVTRAFRFYHASSMMAGLLSASGWPSVVAIMANWFGKGKRGLVMGVWNAHTSVGNILGAVVASQALTYGWGWAFVCPGLMLAAGGVVVFLCLLEHPADLSVGRQIGSPRVPQINAVVRNAAHSSRMVVQLPQVPVKHCVRLEPDIMRSTGVRHHCKPHF